MTDFRDANRTEQDQDGNDEFSREFQRLAAEEKGRAPEGAEPGSEDSGRGSGQDERQQAPEGAAAGREEDRQEQAPEGAADPATDGSSGTEPDIWADAPQALRDAHEAERQKRIRAEGVVRSQDSRLSAAARELHQLRQQAAPGRDAGGATPAGEEAANEEERYAQLRQEFPEVAAPLLDRIVKAEQRLAQVEGAAATVETERTQTFFDHQEQLLDEAHPDWRDQVGKQEFVDWARAQPEYTRKAILLNARAITDAEAVTDILTRFKGAAAPKAADLLDQRQRRREGGQLPRPKSPAAQPGDRGTEFGAEWNRLREQERRDRRAAR